MKLMLQFSKFQNSLRNPEILQKHSAETQSQVLHSLTPPRKAVSHMGPTVEVSQMQGEEAVLAAVEDVLGEGLSSNIPDAYWVATRTLRVLVNVVGRAGREHFKVQEFGIGFFSCTLHKPKFPTAHSRLCQSQISLPDTSWKVFLRDI